MEDIPTWHKLISLMQIQEYNHSPLEAETNALQHLRALLLVNFSKL